MSGKVVSTFGLLLYFFRKRSAERARELAMEQELEDMIQRQRGIKHGIVKAQRMEDGLNGEAYNKQRQLQMLEEARDNLINIQNAHLGTGPRSNLRWS